jgi:hypothetical protein
VNACANGKASINAKALTTTRYLIKFYRQHAALYGFSVLSLLCCYLTVGILFAFAALVEARTTQTFDQYFRSARYVLTGPQGLAFHNGKLATGQTIAPGTLSSFDLAFPATNGKRISTGTTTGTAYLVISDTIAPARMRDFADQQHLRFLSSFAPTGEKVPGYIYAIQEHTGRFAIFSFGTQLSAAVLGGEMATEIGRLSRLIFAVAAALTFYVTLLYTRERRTESAILLLQGYIDLNLRITLADCIVQNLLAFGATCALVPFVLNRYTHTAAEWQAGLGGLAYILPYLPVIIVLQTLVLLNQSLTYATRIQ